MRHHHDRHEKNARGGGHERSRERGPEPFRLRHGDVRAALLLALQEGPAHGYELGQRLERKSGGAWRPSPGSIYPTLQALADEDCISSEERDGKRVHTLTAKGLAELREREARSEGLPWEGADEDGAGDLRDAVVGLKYAAKQINAVGSRPQRIRATAIVLAARRQLYELLAEGTR
jgi:DNA-binding PadR family transcriptional regulator